MKDMNYTKATWGSCPNCNADFSEDTGFHKICEYQTDSDKELVMSHDGYQWSEDRQCLTCGEVYSITNGC